MKSSKARSILQIVALVAALAFIAYRVLPSSVKAAAINNAFNGSQISETEISGAITAVNGNEITINGMKFVLSTGSEVKSNLQVGSFVKVHATLQSDGTYLVREVEAAVQSTPGPDDSPSQTAEPSSTAEPSETPQVSPTPDASETPDAWDDSDSKNSSDDSDDAWDDSDSSDSSDDSNDSYDDSDSDDSDDDSSDSSDDSNDSYDDSDHKSDDKSGRGVLQWMFTL